jgi:DNA invertase Pin-like site-specific DNA recombinase
MAKIGYARVSSQGQSYTAQVEALKAAGCDRIYSEKASAKSTDKRPQFQKMMRDVLPGDIVVVAKLDRLARSTRDLANILHDLTKQDCGFVSLGESWADTATSIGRLMLTIMGGIAEFERELIQARTSDGIERAKRKGTKFGRKRSLSPEQVKVAAEAYAAGKTLAELALDYECSEATMSRIIRPRATAPFEAAA